MALPPPDDVVGVEVDDSVCACDRVGEVLLGTFGMGLVVGLATAGLAAAAGAGRREGSGCAADFELTALADLPVGSADAFIFF